MFKTKISVFFVMIVFCLLQATPNILYQVNSFQSFANGDYEEKVAYSQLKKLGNFGIGTFTNLDGEMLALDGKFYQIKSNGTVYTVNDDAFASFGNIVAFKPQQTKTITGTFSDTASLFAIIEPMLTNKNIAYAIKINASFPIIKARSVPAQTKPYPPLQEVLKKQSIFDYENRKGTLVGFWMPQKLQPLNVPGFHFHFISNDRIYGGHLLAGQIVDPIIEIEPLPILQLFLSNTTESN